MGAAEVCVHAREVKSQPFTVGVGTPTKVCAATNPLHSLHELNRQSQLSRGGCHSWEL